MNNLQKDQLAYNLTWVHYILPLLYSKFSLCFLISRYRSILQLVKPWYDEVKDYAFPYPQDCNPRCPMRCFGPMCTHYTQVILIVLFIFDSYFKKMLLLFWWTWIFLAPTSITVYRFTFSDGLGHFQSNRMRNSYLSKHECLGSCMAPCSLFGMQLCPKVSIQSDSTSWNL